MARNNLDEGKYIIIHSSIQMHTELCWCSLRPELRLIGTTDFRLCVTVGKKVCNQLAHLYIAMQSDPY